MTTRTATSIVNAIRETRVLLGIRKTCLADQMHHAEHALLSLNAATAPLSDLLDAIAAMKEISLKQEACHDQMTYLDDLGVDIVVAICSGTGTLTLTAAQERNLVMPEFAPSTVVSLALAA